MAELPTSLGRPHNPQARFRPVSVSADTGLNLQMQAQGKRSQGLRYVAEGLGDVNKAFEAVSLRNDKLAARDQLTAYSQQAQLLLYGDGTPENPGYYNLQGQDALDQAKPYSEKLTKLQSDFASKAPNKRVAEMFQGASTDYNLAESQNMAQWSAKQGQVAYKASSDAAIQQAFNRAMAGANSDPIVQQSLLVATNETLDQLNHGGIKDPTARQVAVNETRSKLLTGVIGAATQSQGYAAGLNTYNKYKDSIDGTARVAIEADLEQAHKAEIAEQEHKALMADRAADKADEAAFDWLSKAYTESHGNVTPSMIAEASKRGLKGRNAMMWTDKVLSQEKAQATLDDAQAKKNAYIDISSRLDTKPDEVAPSQIYMSGLDEPQINQLIKKREDALKDQAAKIVTNKEKSLQEDLLVDPSFLTKDRIKSLDLPPDRTEHYNNLIDNLEKAKLNTQQSIVWKALYNSIIDDAGSVSTDTILNAGLDDSVTKDLIKERDDRLKSGDTVAAKTALTSLESDLLLAPEKVTRQRVAGLAKEIGPEGMAKYRKAIEENEKLASDKLKVTTNPAVYNDVIKRLLLPPTDPKAIKSQEELFSMIGNGITKDDYGLFNSFLKDRQAPAVKAENDSLARLLDTANRAIDQSTIVGKDSKGPELVAQFTSEALSEFNRRKAAGESASDLLDANNPKSLYSLINSPKYHRSTEQILKDRFSAAGSVGQVDKPTAPEVIATPKTKAEFDALPPGTLFWKKNPKTGVIEKRIK